MACPIHFPVAKPMEHLTEEEIYDLLGVRCLEGNAGQRRKLLARIGELAAINGVDWIRANRDQLLEQCRQVLVRRWIR